MEEMVAIEQTVGRDDSRKKKRQIKRSHDHYHGNCDFDNLDPTVGGQGRWLPEFFFHLLFLSDRFFPTSFYGQSVPLSENGDCFSLTQTHNPALSRKWHCSRSVRGSSENKCLVFFKFTFYLLLIIVSFFVILIVLKLFRIFNAFASTAKNSRRKAVRLKMGQKRDSYHGFCIVCSF